MQRVTSIPLIISAASTAWDTARTVFSILTTTPLRNPLYGLVPTPVICITPFSESSPITARIRLVPISRPTTASLKVHPPLAGMLPFLNGCQFHRHPVPYPVQHPAPASYTVRRLHSTPCQSLRVPANAPDKSRDHIRHMPWVLF